MSSNKKHFDGAKTADDERNGKIYVKKKRGQLDRQFLKEKIDDISNKIESKDAVSDTQSLVKMENNITTVEKGEKVAYNPLLHSTSIVDEFTSQKHCRKRYRKRDKQTDKKINN